MRLRREIDDPLWPEEFLVLGNEHLANAHLASIASARISFEVSGELLLEHQGNSLAMMPTVFTVFTTASTSASSRFPCA